MQGEGWYESGGAHSGGIKHSAFSEFDNSNSTDGEGPVE